ncbi:MAG: twin-arginine translocation signal domain-containing protein [Planctomycetes bacterium]|nr:twin-arginine translocation signal domain-containing protein [Planctomycetota bacterium]
MSDSTPSRRQFVKQSAALTAAGALAANLNFARSVYAAGSDTIRIGLVGCGGRGTGAAGQAMTAGKDVKLVALGDAFMDKVEGTLSNLTKDFKDQVDVPKERCFDGFDAYKNVIDNVDVVLLATPPGFRPIHLKYAVEKGKHVFCEKPVATDAPGVRDVIETVALAKQKNITIVSGLCYRYQHAKQETVKRIHDGAIGDILAAETYYWTGGLWHRGDNEKWSRMEYQMRNWLYHTWLSGDHITEQHIHSIDKIAWVMGDEPPVSVQSMGGRIARTDPKYGNIYDHFYNVYEWKNGMKLHSSCRQLAGNSKCHNGVNDYLIGNKGKAELQSHSITGENEWKFKLERGVSDDMYQNEHNELFAALRAGRTINNGTYMAQSTMMAIMGRMSAYTGQKLTWDQALNSQEKLVPDTFAWGPAPEPKVAIPGETKFA